MRPTIKPEDLHEIRGALWTKVVDAICDKIEQQMRIKGFSFIYPTGLLLRDVVEDASGTESKPQGFDTERALIVAKNRFIQEGWNVSIDGGRFILEGTL